LGVDSVRGRRITIVGGGLAGSEAAWQAVSRGVPVVLHEMRPVKPTAVHKTDGLAELVCSNSFRGDKLDNAVGLLKEEMRRLGSLIMRCADEARVPAGAALAVDRDLFSSRVTEAIASHPLISIRRGEITTIPSRGRPRDRRDRSAHLRRAVGGDRRARRLHASLLLRRDQPHRERRVHRPLEGLPRVPLGQESSPAGASA
jgi:hypothetical protein